jgi:hypothetical protein
MEQSCKPWMTGGGRFGFHPRDCATASRKHTTCAAPSSALTDIKMVGAQPVRARSQYADGHLDPRFRLTRPHGLYPYADFASMLSPMDILLSSCKDHFVGCLPVLLGKSGWSQVANGAELAPLAGSIGQSPSLTDGERIETRSLWA